MSRRTFLGFSVGVAATVTLASCAPAPTWIQPDSSQVRDAERRRRGTGRVTNVTLTAARTELDLAGVTASTWAYGAVPAPVIRAGAGDTLKATVHNQLPHGYLHPLARGGCVAQRHGRSATDHAATRQGRK